MDHEDHLTVTTEKFRNEMAKLITYVQRAEKHLKDSIATKVTANMKIITVNEIVFSVINARFIEQWRGMTQIKH